MKGADSISFLHKNHAKGKSKMKKKLIAIVTAFLFAGFLQPVTETVKVNAETNSGLSSVSIEAKKSDGKKEAKNKKGKKKKSKKAKKQKKSKKTSSSKTKKKSSAKKKTKKSKKAKDTVAPVITVKNGTLTRGASYTASDYYSVTDNKTKSPTVAVSGDVDPNTEGDYTVTVTAKDKTGNQSDATYTISVVAPTCDGTTVTEGCVLDGVRYNRYIYHPAVEKQSHMEQRSSTEQVITGYCTLCMDNTYSPTCATGQGACSHHGGVQQWNAPRYGTSTNTWEEEVIDVAPQDAWIETEVAP